MQKIYIDIDNDIWIDPDCTTITFDKPINGEMRDPIIIRQQHNQQIWDIFRHLFLNRNTPVRNQDLYRVGEFDSYTAKARKTNLHRCINALKKIFNPSESSSVNDKKSPYDNLKITTITDKKNNRTLAIESTSEAIDENQDLVLREGTYTLYVPTKLDWLEVIAQYYWDAYSIIGAQKYLGRYDTSSNGGDLEKKLVEVFQTPQLISSQGGEWSQNHERANNRFLIAPNGWGKTAFLRSLLLSCLSEYNKELTDSEKEKYAKIKVEFLHTNKYFPIYLECQYINFDLLEADLKNSSHTWIYRVLCARLLINRHISEYIFFQSISSHLTDSGAVLLLVDGFDEISKANRNLLLTALTKYQESTNFDPDLFTIIATRPLPVTERFFDFDKWYLADVKQNPDYLRAYINAYAGSEKAEEIASQIEHNHYLNDLVTTPTTLVWTIKTCLAKKPVYEAVEEIMTEVMQRNNYSKLRTRVPAYKKIYAELAYKYLTQLTNDSNGINCSERNFFSWLHNTLDSLANRGEREIIKLLDANDNDGEELEQLFLTQVALMEFDAGRLRFSTPVYTYHLVARRILSSLDSPDDSLLNDLNRIPYASRYKTIVATLTLGEHFHDPMFNDISYESATDMRQRLADMFYKYLSTRFNAPAITKEEKEAILASIDDILSERYGSNVFTGSDHNPTHKRSLEEILKTKG